MNSAIDVYLGESLEPSCGFSFWRFIEKAYFSAGAFRWRVARFLFIKIISHRTRTSVVRGKG